MGVRRMDVALAVIVIIDFLHTATYDTLHRQAKDTHRRTFVARASFGLPLSSSSWLSVRWASPYGRHYRNPSVDRVCRLYQVCKSTVECVRVDRSFSRSSRTYLFVDRINVEIFLRLERRPYMRVRLEDTLDDREEDPERASAIVSSARCLHSVGRSHGHVWRT